MEEKNRGGGMEEEKTGKQETSFQEGQPGGLEPCTAQADGQAGRWVDRQKADRQADRWLDRWMEEPVVCPGLRVLVQYLSTGASS